MTEKHSLDTERILPCITSYVYHVKSSLRCKFLAFLRSLNCVMYVRISFVWWVVLEESDEVRFEIVKLGLC